MGTQGLLFVFEGVDGAGKSTQARLLGSAITAAGRTVRLTREPTDGPFGQQIRASARTGRLPLREELELFLLDRRQHVEATIRPALDRGEVVIIDRYYFSTVAYQGARGMDPRALLELNESFAPVPDRVYLLDLEPKQGVSRVRTRDVVEDAFEGEEDLRRAREIFRWVASQRAFVRIFDASGSPHDLHAHLLADALRLITA